jgi:acyl-CoA synthetase (AMP-forming)/AMP-acid ligase II
MITIPEMLARNARMYPSDCALTEIKPCEEYRREITWMEFDEDANRLANSLINMGIKKGDSVILWMMNSIDWLIVYFGILRTGAWAVPLNFRFTAEEFKYCAEVSGASIAVIGHEFIERVNTARAQFSGVEQYIAVAGNKPDYMLNYYQLFNNVSTVQPDIEIKETDFSSLYFTSGTTGTPKPILLTHGNIKSAAITEVAHHYQNRSDNFILIPPLYHTGSKMHWFGNLIVGAKATLLNEVNPRSVLQTVNNEKGTIVWLLVPWAQDILSSLDRGDLILSDYDLSTWRLMHIGAQPVPPSLVKRWKQYFPDMQYDTNYGLSESTGPGCVHLGIENERKVGAIGVPGFNWEACIVDDKRLSLSNGQIGELIVKGDGVMSGYFNNPSKTSEALIDGWLYTGDMAMRDEDGFIYLVDRKKDVIITGGENIFPVEIEDALHNIKAVKDVAAIGIPDERLGEIAAVVVELHSGEQLTESDILTFCKQNLARYKVPRRVIFDKVPRNPTGKIEKPKLREKYSK